MKRQWCGSIALLTTLILICYYPALLRPILLHSLLHILFLLQYYTVKDGKITLKQDIIFSKNSAVLGEISNLSLVKLNMTNTRTHISWGHD
jgi:hypothetical protein